MADGSGRRFPLEDAYNRREREFVRAQGISELAYTELLELSAVHASKATRNPAAPPWRFVGPRDLGGRVISIEQDPLDPRIIYVGSAHGGLWRSLDAGDTWNRLGDDEHVFPVGTIAVAPGAPNVLYFGTGAPDPSYVSGRGLYRASIDGSTGAATIERLAKPDDPSVAPVNAAPGAALRYTRIRVDPDDPTRFWAASQTGLWRCDCPLAQPAVPKFTRDFPDANNKPAVAALVAVPDRITNLWPSHCTDLLVAHDPRETETVSLNGANVPRYLILYVAVDGAGIFRGRCDRKDNNSVTFESTALELPLPADYTFGRVRMALCERQPQHLVCILALSRFYDIPPTGSKLQPALDGLGAPIPRQYHATNGTDGSSPGLTTLLRAKDKLSINTAAGVETQTVTAVVNDTDVTMAAAFVTPFVPAGFTFFRDIGPEHDHASEAFFSADNGDTWLMGAQRMAAVGGLTGQAGYDLAIDVAPDDASIVVAGEGEICMSRDFGSSWTKILDWEAYDQGDKAQHADEHFVMFDRGDHKRLWVGNDGGLSLARDLRLPVQADGYWRKRSHGIYAGQAQDISANPGMPFMSGAGFQDNGTHVSLGGPTWYHIGGADGGAMAFNLTNPRQFAVTWQGSQDNPDGDAIERVDAVAEDAPLTVAPPPPAVIASEYDLVSIAAGDLPESIARGHRVRYRWTSISQWTLANGIVSQPLFVGSLEQHPVQPSVLMAGMKDDGYWTTNFGVAWTTLRPPVAPPANAQIAPGGEVAVMAFGSVDPLNPLGANVVDGWAGTSFGSLFFTNNAPTGVWAPVATPIPFPGRPLPISEVYVHPRDRRIVAVSTGGFNGRVFLTYDQGRSWIDLTEPTPTSVTVAPASVAPPTISIGVGEMRAFTATATYPGGVSVDATWRAAWSNTVGGGTVSIATGDRGFGAEGQVTALKAGAATVQAQLIANVATAVSSQAVTVTAAAQPVVTIPARPRDLVPGSVPPGPIASIIFDPSTAVATAATLLAGTLSGVYSLAAIPVVQTLAIEPGGPIAFQTGAVPFQLRCVATFTDGTKIDVSRDADWTTSAVGTGSVDATGLVTLGALGSATISVNRGGVPAATIVVTVQGGAAPAAPALPAAPAATNPPITVEWQLFSAGLPNVLVTDFERIGGTNAIRAATFGLGVFECVTAGGPLQQLHIRQTIIEDGRTYPRVIPPTVTHDPRLPAGVVALDFAHAFDIRVDAPPYSFFDDVVDGVEMDEQIEVADPVPSEDNYVYVQVHNTGTSDMASVTLHLYAAECGAADVINPVGAVATASPASLDASAPIADFYGQPNRDPLPASLWKRVDAARTIDVDADAPLVVRFTWRPDVLLSDKNVALLALCEGPALSNDPLPPAPAAATLSAFILAERRAAVRVVHVAQRAAASLYVRDGVADDTRLGGYPVAGRSPDIMVMQAPVVGTPDVLFKDFVARRTTDVISGSKANVIFVRVHNRRRFETKAKVKVFAVPLDDGNTPNTSTAAWTELPSGAAFADVTVPASGVGYAQIDLPAAGDPNATGTNKALLLLALVKSEDDTDPLPNKDRVDSVDAFWDLISRYVDSDNAAGRALLWVP